MPEAQLKIGNRMQSFPAPCSVMIGVGLCGLGSCRNTAWQWLQVQVCKSFSQGLLQVGRHVGTRGMPFVAAPEVVHAGGLVLAGQAPLVALAVAGDVHRVALLQLGNLLLDLLPPARHQE